MRRITLTLAVLTVAGLATSAAEASGPHRYAGHVHGGYGWGGGYGGYGRSYGGGYGVGYGGLGYGGGFRAPIYHAPSVHYDRVYHPDYQHWTPGRGWHTHGHTHIVPHYVPGHVDTLHNNHIHANPWFHH